jgi:cold shock protein
MMPTGTVRFFCPIRGFGFIVPDQSSVDDVYLHRDALVAAGLPDLRDGQRVTYHYRRDPKGRMQVSQISLAPAFDQ